MSKLSISLDQKLCVDYSDNRDDKLFRNEILSRIRPGDTILDLGAEAGIVRQMNFRGLAGRVCSDIRHVATAAGFEVESIRLLEGRPEYLRMWASNYLSRLFVRKTGQLLFRSLVLSHLVDCLPTKTLCVAL